MKLYLATSSLNIDNILSTESVAPLSFYKYRTYGYNSFCELELLPFKNVLVLFTKIPYFKIVDSEHDNRPVILEISINEEKIHLNNLGEHEGIFIYSTDTILRLTPFNTRFLFLNPQDLNHARLSCSDSFTNKLGDRFRFDLCKTDFDLAYISSLNISVNDECVDINKKILLDNRLNTIKGFMYGYYLGVSKSVTPDSATLLRIQKRIYDIAATIKNNGGYSNSLFLEELEKLDKEYRANDPNTKKCKELWKKTLEELAIPSDSLNKLLELYDEKSILKNTFIRKKGLQPSVSLRQYGYDNIETYRDNIKKHTIQIVKDDQQQQLSFFDVKRTFDLDPTYETCMLYGEDSEAMIFNKFIDAILWHGNTLTPDILRTNRFDVATRITISVKEIWESFGRGWKDSSAQFFMNELRQNIKSFTPVDIHKQENIILKSIAAFVLKGEDFDSLVQFCEDNGYSDYRYALALWGAIQGYVRMSKPVVSGLVKSSSFCKIYKDFIYLLYGEDSEGVLPNVEDIKIVEQKPLEVQSSINLQERENSIDDWQNEIRSYLDQLKNVPKKKELYAPLENAFIENGNQKDYVKFFAILNDYKEWKTSKGEPIKAWKSMVEHFCPEDYARTFGGKVCAPLNPKKNGQTIIQKDSDLFGLSGDETIVSTAAENSTSSIIFDANAVPYIENAIMLGKYRSQIVSMFCDFQKNYQSGYYYKNSQQYKRNNNDVVDHFCKWCLSQKNKNAIQWSPENRRMIENLKEYLLKRYHD